MFHSCKKHSNWTRQKIRFIASFISFIHSSAILIRILTAPTNAELQIPLHTHCLHGNANPLLLSYAEACLFTLSLFLCASRKWYYEWDHSAQTTVSSAFLKFKMFTYSWMGGLILLIFHNFYQIWIQEYLMQCKYRTLISLPMNNGIRERIFWSITSITHL